MQNNLRNILTEEHVKGIFEEFIEKKSIFKNKKVLTANYIPNEILHRDNEIKQLSSILAASLHGYQPSNIFLYGTVGTGKSITTRFVLKELMKTAEKRNNKIKTIYMNCKMKKVADTEYRLMAQMLKDFNEFVPETGLPTDVLYRRFFDKIDAFKGVVIIALDEIDVLINKVGDEFLYNLTRINSELKNSQVSIIGITNNLSFIDNIDTRVRSSLGEEEIVFSPYNAKELSNIINYRVLEGFNENSIKPSAVNKSAALAAQEHGDARRALDLVRVAGEVAERTGEENVSERHVDLAQKKIDVDRVLETIKNQPKQSQFILYSIIKLNEQNKKSTGEIYNYYKDLCSHGGINSLTQRRFSDLVNELDMLSIINTYVVSKGRYGRTREITLNVPDDLIIRIKKILEERVGYNE